MLNLEKAISTETRDQLVEIARLIGRNLSPELLLDRDQPFIITMNGDPVSGKSLYWDYIKDELLGDSANINPSFSEDITSDDRVYETWVGKEKTSQKPLRVFFCNLDSSFLRSKDTRNIETRLLRSFDSARFTSESGLREFGDLIITSNRVLLENDINITLKDKSGINYGNGVSTEWHRLSTITVSPELEKQIPKLQRALRVV